MPISYSLYPQNLMPNPAGSQPLINIFSAKEKSLRFLLNRSFCVVEMDMGS